MVQQNQTYKVFRVSADQLLTQSSTTLQDITSLVCPVDVSKSYKFRLSLYVEGKADSDCKATAIGPASSAGVIDLDTVNPKVNPIGTAVATSLTDDTLSLIVMEGVITTDSTHSGNLQIQAAQNISEADQLTVKAGSMLEVWEVTNTT